MNQVLKTAVKHWTYVAPILSFPNNDKELEELTEKLDTLLEIAGNDENHPLIGLIDIMSKLIASYEEKHYQESVGKGIDALKYLMSTNNLHQTDLPELGSQGVVSEILNKKRTLNIRQIKLLAKRFHVTPHTFID